jgi:hypothetical protein
VLAVGEGARVFAGGGEVLRARGEGGVADEDVAQEIAGEVDERGEVGGGALRVGEALLEGEEGGAGGGDVDALEVVEGLAEGGGVGRGGVAEAVGFEEPAGEDPGADEVGVGAGEAGDHAGVGGRERGRVVLGVEAPQVRGGRGRWLWERGRGRRRRRRRASRGGAGA